MRYSIFSVHDHYPNEKRTVGQHYQETIENIILAEELGYDSYWVAEHHFHDYGTVPNPAVLLAAASQSTRRIGLGVAITVLPFRNPLLVAEDYAMLDNLSGGRLLLGVGSGYLKHEFAGFEIDPTTKRHHFDENLAVLKKVMSGEKFSFNGKHNQINSVRINVPMVQREGPLFYVAALRKEVAYYIGKQGNGMLSIPYATVDHLDELGSIITEYKRGWYEHNPDLLSPPINFSFHAHVCETDIEARRTGEKPFNHYIKTRLYGKSSGWDAICERGYCVFGGIDTCIERLKRMREIGIEHVSFLMDFGFMGKIKTQNSMRLMAERVIPHIT